MNDLRVNREQLTRDTKVINLNMESARLKGHKTYVIYKEHEYLITGPLEFEIR